MLGRLAAALDIPIGTPDIPIMSPELISVAPELLDVLPDLPAAGLTIALSLCHGWHKKAYGPDEYHYIFSNHNLYFITMCDLCKTLIANIHRLENAALFRYISPSCTSRHWKTAAGNGANPCAHRMHGQTANWINVNEVKA